MSELNPPFPLCPQKAQQEANIIGIFFSWNDWLNHPALLKKKCLVPEWSFSNNMILIDRLTIRKYTSSTILRKFLCRHMDGRFQPSHLQRDLNLNRKTPGTTLVSFQGANAWREGTLECKLHQHPKFYIHVI